MCPMSQVKGLADDCIKMSFKTNNDNNSNDNNNNNSKNNNINNNNIKKMYFKK